MFNVILVDDEPWTLSGIEKTFSWAEHGFNVIFRSTNPFDAFEQCLKQDCDVVFLDIRMPGLSGIEFMEKLTGRKDPPLIVVISGFDEFKYVQKAMHYGAFDYYLKPIKKDETSELLIKIKKKLMEKRRIEGIELLDSLGSDEGDLRKELFARGLPGRYSYWSVAIVKDRLVERLAVLNPSGKTDYIALRSDKKKTAFILNSNTDKPEIDTDNDSGVWGISTVSESPETLFSLYKEADIAVESDFFGTDETFFRYKKNKRSAIRKLSENLSLHYRNRRYEELKNGIKMIPQLFGEKIFSIEALVFFWNEILSSISGNESGALLYDYNCIVKNFSGIEDYCHQLYTLIIDREALGTEDISGSRNNNFTKMLNYLEIHFCENLQLRGLSDQFGINYTYCSELCNKILGTSFSKYINQLRIKEACSLIDNTEKSLQEIAETVGYSDYFYFSRVFRKTMDLSPLKYRNMRDKVMIEQ
ncbi:MULTISPECIES: response regulator [unclassified Oceanispirochaeta]|uniref:response regulator transcription factor n=1 Tax=unclassified Oceanispirochaeta TaxID=2635722 RepID=UPI000E093A8F|nr:MULTISPECIES: response regulator [unclassified Oceanispirochaeta]MBF9013983.1 response regulator [Oceanispirochaeta sp. M2]NPD70474.1 response regulator [Oceanispirochaeta sp. M1]RDG34244.1 response regulator [Oceanispirochaeta sp. M1]